MKVDFMIIGAMKCGTSTMATILSAHPDVSFSRPKEPNYFSDVSNWREELDRYHSYFRHKEARIYGEGSTNYTKFPTRKISMVRDLYEYNPQLKFIYLVRHPVERAISQFLHGYQRGTNRMPLSQGLIKSDNLFIGRYYTQIIPYIEQFGMEQVMIIKFEDFVRDTNTAMVNVAAFLGIDPGPLILETKVMSNVTSSRHVMSMKQEKQFAKYFRPFKPYLPNVINNMIRSMYLKSNQKRISGFKMHFTSEEEEKILRYTYLDIIKLQEIVSFDISDYLVPAEHGKYSPGEDTFPFQS